MSLCFNLEIRGSLTYRVKDRKTGIGGCGVCTYKRKRERVKNKGKGKEVRGHIRSSAFVSRVCVCRDIFTLHCLNSYFLSL